jgi:hypothetical protein
MKATWRLTMFLPCLIAALSRTPLRQAEAADDFARSIAELGRGDVIETLDGGVGVDTEASILKAGSDTHFLSATILQAMADVDLTPPVTASFLTSAMAAGPVCPVSSRQAPTDGLPGFSASYSDAVGNTLVVVRP